MLVGPGSSLKVPVLDFSVFSFSLEGAGASSDDEAFQRYYNGVLDRRKAPTGVESFALLLSSAAAAAFNFS